MEEKDYRSKIVNHGYPKDQEIGVVDMHTTYIQQTDTCGDSEQEPYQQLMLETVGVEFCEKENTDAFIRMRVGKKYPDEVDVADFWSINGLEDLVSIFNNFERRRGSTIQYQVTKIVTLPDGTKEETKFE